MKNKILLLIFSYLLTNFFVIKCFELEKEDSIGSLVKSMDIEVEPTSPEIDFKANKLALVLKNKFKQNGELSESGFLLRPYLNEFFNCEFERYLFSPNRDRYVLFCSETKLTNDQIRKIINGTKFLGQYLSETIESIERYKNIKL